METSFLINPLNGTVSKAFYERGIRTFRGAGEYVRQLPFRRPNNPENILAALIEECGTCTNKHAALLALAHEHGYTNLCLVIEIYKSDTSEYPGLSKHLAPYIPAAHAVIYQLDPAGNLEFRMDFSRPEEISQDNKDYEILQRVVVSLDEIVHRKAEIYKDYLRKWLELGEISMSVERILIAREERMKKRLDQP